MHAIDNYEEIAQHSRTSRKRDIIFAVILAAVAAFTATSLGAASKHVSETPTANTCAIQPWC